MVQYNLQLLGPFKLEHQNLQNDRFESDKARALLAFLATEPQAYHRETLATLLWPDRPDKNARRNLSQALYNLRQVTSSISEDLFEITSKTIRFLPNEHFKVDVIQFEQSLRTVAHHSHPHGIVCDDCNRQLTAAVERYRGEFLTGLYISNSTGFEDWFRQKRETLRSEFVEALQLLAQSSETLGDFSSALKYLQRMQEFDPLNDEICRKQMRLLGLSGQRNNALKQYEYFRQVVWDELGIEPEETTQSLYQHMLAIDKSDESSIYPLQRLGLQGSRDDTWGEAQTLEIAGEMARSRGQYASAKELHERALKLYQANDDKQGIARSYGYLGLTVRDTGDFIQARHFVEQARAIYLELSDRFSVAEANSVLARLLSVMGDFPSTIDLLNTVLVTYRDLGLQQRVAYHTIALGMYHMMLGRYDEARTNAAQGMKLGYVVQDQLSICWGMDILGMVAIVEEIFPTAEQLLKQTLVLANAIGRPEELGSALGGLGYVMLRTGRPGSARLHIREGLQLGLKSQNFIAALFVLPPAALFLKMQGVSKHADELYSLCNRFAFFHKSVFFSELYAPYFEDTETRQLEVEENDMPVNALRQALDNAVARI